jgi:rhomboid family protein
LSHVSDGDDNCDIRAAPIVNYVIIALNIMVFVFFQRLGSNERFTYAYATVPAEIWTGKDIVTNDRVIEDRQTGEQFTVPRLQPTPSVYFTLLSSIFMHGGIAHIAGNMWFLWIFGDNVEDRMGRLRYAVFYLLTGLVASLSHVLMNLRGDGSLVPSLGA